MNINNCKKILATMSVLLTLGFVTDSVYAQDRVPLVVAPARMQLNVNPGENYNLSVKFINEAQQPVSGIIKVVDFIVTNDNGFPRSEEHTSELQSHVNLVCRLPLEKKKRCRDAVCRWLVQTDRTATPATTRYVYIQIVAASNLRTSKTGWPPLPCETS